MTDAELAILHLLIEKPRHGYEIEEVIEQRGMREWTAIGFSSIYYLLNKLEKVGLVEKSLQEIGQGPARKVFRITPAGLQKLREGALASLASYRGNYQSLLLGLANLTILYRDEALEAIGRHRDGLAEHRSNVARRAEQQRPLPDVVEALFDYSLTMMDARLTWLDTFIDAIKSGRFDWPAPGFYQEDQKYDPQD